MPELIDSAPPLTVPKTNRRRTLSIVALCATVILVFAVLFTWYYLGPAPLVSIRVLPLGVSLSALMLFCVGALICIEFDKKRIATFLVAPAVFAVVTTILGWVFGWTLSFGYTLLGDPSSPANWFPPRGAIDAMIPSALVSFAVLFLSFERFTTSAAPFAWATGVLLMIAAPLRLFGFASSDASIVDYARSRPVELAVTFALISMGCALVCTRDVARSIAKSQGTRWRSLMLVTAVAATLELWYAVRAAEIRQLRSDVDFAIEESARAYRAGLAENGTSADLLWQHWRNMDWQVDDQVFLRDADDYMRTQRAVLAMGMFDTHGRLLRLARRNAAPDAIPAIEDRIVLGGADDLAKYGSNESVHAQLVELALTTKSRQRVAPMIVINQTELVDVVSPVFGANGRPLGASLLLYRRDMGVSRILNEIAPDFHIRLYIDNRLVFDRPPRDGIDPREQRFQSSSTRTFTSAVRYTFEVAPGPKIIDRAIGVTPLLVLLFAWVSLLLLMFALYNERRVQTLYLDRERILDESLDIICTLDASGCYVTVNEASMRILGYRPDEMIGQPYARFAHPGDLALLNSQWQEAQVLGRIPSVPLRFVHRSGRTVYLQGNAHWAVSEALFYSDMRDVTAEYEAQLLRQHAENTFRIGVAQAGCAVYEYQPNSSDVTSGAIIWVGAIRALTGYEADELSALGFAGWMQLIHPDDAAHVRQILQRCLEVRQPHTVDYRLKRKDGSYVPVLDRGRHLSEDDSAPRMIGALIDLTAIRQQENALRRSEERYRIIANQVGAVIIERETASGRIRVFGPAEQIFGYTKEQLESRPFNRNDTMIHPDDRAHFFAAVDEAERTLSSYYVEHRRRHRGGHYIYIASRGVVLPGPDGRAEREVIAITDISERRQAEVRLQENEERFRLAAEQAGQIVYEFTFGEKMQVAEIRFAGATEKVAGYTALELRELQVQDRYFLIHPDDVPLLRAPPSDEYDGTQQYVVEHRMRHRGGHFVHVENRGAVKRDAAGNVVGIVGMLLDITSRRAAEADRQHYTAQLHALADIAHKVGSMLSTHELLKYLTTSMRDLLGVNAAAAMVHDVLLAPAEVVAVSFADHYGLQRGAPSLLGPTELHSKVRSDNMPHRFTAQQMAQDPALAGLTQNDELRHPLRGWMGAPLIARDGANLGLIEISDKIEGEFTDSDLQVLNQLAGLASVAIENIRLYATLEERVAARTRELEISNRELEAFSYSVSHDLRAPLRAIAGFSSILETEHSTALEGPARRYLQRITAGVERMANLIDDLLSLARVSRAELKRETVDVSALCKAIVKRQLERYANRSVDVVVDPRMKAVADPRLVEVALENLVENALKFTGTRERAKIHVGHRRVDGRPVFYVQDNGVGFDPKFASNLFGVFQRLHSASDFPGTGVGLATVQRIVQRHHGRIWAEAEIDGGASFYFTLANEA